MTKSKRINDTSWSPLNYFMNLLYILSLLIVYTSCQTSKPNVLLIVIDDLRPALGIYRDINAHTPNIDKLAQKSFVFYKAFAQQALCAPSRNSFLTSRRPDSLHLYDFYNYWRTTVGNFTTLPQHFKENDYFTYSIGKVFHPGISSNFSDDYPYSWSKRAFHPPTVKYKNAKVCLDSDGKWGINIICPVRVADQPGKSLPDIQSLNEARAFLRENGEKPFFLAVGFHKPHIPLKFPRKYLDLHPIENIVMPKMTLRPFDLPIVAWNPWMDMKSRDDIADLNISFPFGLMPKNVTKAIIQNYAAATSYIDGLVGKLLQNVDNNTIVVLIGDHGVSLGEHGEFSKYSNFDIATRVPFIIHVPGLTNKMVVSKHLVELVDLFPTLVDLTQVSESLEKCKSDRSNEDLCTEGTSLVPHMIDLLRNQKVRNVKGAIFTQYPRPAVYPMSNSDKPKLKDIKIMGYSIRTPEYRYTEWAQFDKTHFKANWSQIYARELYHHEIDPEENLNLATRPELEPIMKTLRGRLIAGWRYA